MAIIKRECNIIDYTNVWRLTIPKEIIREAGITENDFFVAEVDTDTKEIIIKRQ